MNSTFVKLGTFSVALSLVFTACKHSGSFETDSATGVQYQFINHNDKGSKPSMNDFARVEMVGTAVTAAGKDTEMFNTAKKRDPRDTSHTFTIPLNKSFSGCLEQGIAMMSVGDSAIFKISTDSLFLKTFRAHDVPKFLKAGSFITFNIKLVGFQTQAQIQQQQQEEMSKRQAEAEQRKALEAPAIAKYLADNHYEKVKPTADSLFVLERKVGKGPAIKEGDSIEVTYNGTLLDGTVFDASSRHNGALKMVYKKDMQLIKGWVEVLGTMHQGEKVKILLPSALCYGARQAGPMILPYSSLVFDLEVLKVTPNK